MNLRILSALFATIATAILVFGYDVPIIPVILIAVLYVISFALFNYAENNGE